jgi:hypothetical protein
MQEGAERLRNNKEMKIFLLQMFLRHIERQPITKRKTHGTKSIQG